MALCLANSLVVCQDFIPYDQLVRYKWWHRDGYMSSTGKCFDIGAATKRSLEEFEQRQRVFGQKYSISPKEIDFLSNPELIPQFNVDCSQKGVAGNGALMRLAPVPLFFSHYPEYAVEFSGVSGRITHGDKSAYDACRYYGALIVAALRGEKKEQLLADNFYSAHEEWFNKKQLHPDIKKIAEGSYKKPGGYKDGIRGKGYIVHALEAALWAFNYDGDSFEKGVLAAVNLGDDTDTTAAIYGQLAGVYYGYKGLPLKWLEFAYAKSFIKCLSEWIVYEGERWQPNKSHALIMTNCTPQQEPGATTTSSIMQKPNSNPKTFSKKQQGSGSIPQDASKMRSGTEYDGNFQSAPSSKTFNHLTATVNARQDPHSGPGSNWDSDRSETSASTDLNPAQYQDSTRLSSRKSHIFNSVVLKEV
jgi:ADP-ribosyl-[dinitrogen reductase] hydrolase